MTIVCLSFPLEVTELNYTVIIEHDLRYLIHLLRMIDIGSEIESYASAKD